MPKPSWLRVTVAAVLGAGALLVCAPAPARSNARPPRLRLPATAPATCAITPRPAPGEHPARQVTVLIYHHLAPAKLGLHKGNDMILPVPAFRRQVDWLRQQGYYTPSLDEVQAFVAGRLELPEKSVVITFDDGYESNYQYAHPLLCQAGLRAVLFKIGNRKPNDGPFAPDKQTHVTWDQVRAMAGSGVWEIASHTFAGHDPLDGRPPLLVWTLEQIWADVRQEADLWRAHGLASPTAIAYPYGAYDSHTTAALARTAVKLGFTGVRGRVQPGSDPLQLHRLPVLPSTSLAQFQELVQG